MRLVGAHQPEEGSYGREFNQSSAREKVGYYRIRCSPKNAVNI